MAVRVVVAGVAGRMGGTIARLVREEGDLTLAGGIERGGHPAVGKLLSEVVGVPGLRGTVTATPETALSEADVLVDFTTPEGTLANLRLAAPRKVAAVIGTTGLAPAHREEIARLAKAVPCVVSPNMSPGVNVLVDAVRRVVGALGESFDVEIVEAHHRAKKDAPSGTALRLAEAAAEAMGAKLEERAVYARQGNVGERKAGTIGIQTLRGGDIVGDHTVLLAGPGERLELTHRAHSREVFARGAIRAIRWVAGRSPGVYDMADVLGLRSAQGGS